MRVAESFFSVQGEGASVGVPAYFIRLQGCNLMCGGAGGSLVKEGKATWWCDSELLWRKGTEVSYEQLVESFITQGILANILDGSIHLVWTGGEPTLKHHQEDIQSFIDYIDDVYPNNTIFNEIETNGTLVVDESFYVLYIDQINCSPKLANSGIEKHIRCNEDAINQIKAQRNSYFKFVISTEADITEFLNEFVTPFNIPAQKIIIMPGVDNRNDLPERTRFLFEMTKKYGYRGVTRQHILAWDKVTGV